MFSSPRDLEVRIHELRSIGQIRSLIQGSLADGVWGISRNDGNENPEANPQSPHSCAAFPESSFARQRKRIKKNVRGTTRVRAALTRAEDESPYATR
jgi:hypothetical protein